MRTAALLGVLLASGAARAETRDGLYGRFDGDLELRGSAGVAILASAPSLALGASATYLSTGGFYATYTEAFGAEPALTLRSVACGVRVSPVFLARWALDTERGPAHGDLLLDSLALDVGTFWADRRPAPGAAGLGFRETPGFEFGVGFSMPFLPRASGPRVGLRGVLRWTPEAFAGIENDFAAQGAHVVVTFDWSAIVKTGIVDVGDRAPR